MYGNQNAPDVAQYPKLNPSFVPVTPTPNRVHFRAGPWSGPVFSLSDDGGDGELARLVGLLDGSHSIAEVLARFDDDDHGAVVGVLRQLEERRIVYDAAEDAGPEPAGDVAASNWYVSDADLEAIDASVTVVAAGDVGSILLDDLLATGVSAVTVVRAGGATVGDRDDDRVETVDRSAADLRTRLAESDVAAVVADRPAPEQFDAVNRAAHEVGTPFVAGQLCGYDGLVGPMVLPGESSCYECFVGRRDANLPAPDEFRAFQATAERPGPSVSAFARVVEGLVTVDLLNYLSYGLGFTVGRVLHYDFSYLRVEGNEVLRLPRCDVCGKPTGDVDVNRHVTFDGLVRELWGDDS